MEVVVRVGGWGGGGVGGDNIPIATLSPPECEPVWPSGKALGW